MRVFRRGIRWTTNVVGGSLVLAASGAIGVAAGAQPSASPAQSVSVQQTSSGRIRIIDGFEEPLVAVGRPTAQENRALTAAIQRYQRHAPQPDLHAFDSFLEHYPSSPWTASLLTDLGIADYHNGYFTEALAAWHQAWERGRKITDPAGRVLVDRAFGELIRMHARLGHAHAVETLLTQVENRPITGAASEDVTGAREGLWQMRNQPGFAYLCGPMALRSLLMKLDPGSKGLPVLEAYRSGTKGVNLGQLTKLAGQAGMRLKAAYRERGMEIPVPSVINWKLNHYAAIVDKRGGRYEVEDPTFGRELWLTADAINAQASGFFLVQDGWDADGWRPASQQELEHVYGRGKVTSVNQSDTTTFDITSGHNCADSPTPMCGYRIQSLVVGLTLSDTPVGYRPPIGPAAVVTLTYNQRDASQPAIPTYFNFGPKWTSNWLSYVEDDPATPGANVKEVLPGGGYATETGFNKKSGAFRAQSRDHSVLVRVSADPIRYEQRFRDGSVYVYAQSDGSSMAPRRIFLSKIIDSAGNALALTYDKKMRLGALIDATGRKTTFSYDLETRPFLVTGITDPFSRHARIEYDLQGRLERITDVIGLVSQVHYDRNGVVDSLTTPYGTSRFSYTEKGIERSLNATDPMGYTERVEFHQGAAGIPTFSSFVPKGIGVDNRYLQYRNTFYWDKNAFRRAPGDYTKAEIIHWFHQMPGTAAGTVESVKFPLEHRIWFDNPGSRGYYTGYYDVPSRIARVLEDGSTQLTQIDYSKSGNVSRVVDAAGRLTQMDYAPNGIDVISIRQLTGPRKSSVVARFTYDKHHRPLTYTNAAGATTKFTYNAHEQIIAETNPLGQTIRFNYDKLGYLTDVVGANGKIVEHLSYDAFGRVAARTDARGGTVTYTYDAVNRPLKVTYPDGTSETFVWDRLDLASFTDRSGAVTHYTYDADRRLLSRKDALGGTTLYTYYPGGELRTRTDPDGRKTTWLRDIEGRVIARIAPNGSVTRFIYGTGSQRLQSITDPLGQTRVFTYTLDDRLASRRVVSGNKPGRVVRFKYDRYFPRLASMTDWQGTTTFTYGAPGKPGALQPVAISGPGGQEALHYSYDRLGRIIERTLGSRREAVTYDAMGRIATRQNELGTFSYTYLGETSLPVTEALSGSPFTVHWFYQDPGKGGGLSRLQYGKAFDIHLEISPLGQVLKVASAGAQHNYAYDAAGRLISATRSGNARRTYTYDGSGNLRAITTPSGKRHIRIDTGTDAAKGNQTVSDIYRVDADGHLIEDAGHHYRWNANGRLIEITYKQSPKRVSRFRYDGFGRRVADMEETAKGKTVTRYTWCGMQLCQVRDANGGIMRDLYNAGEVDFVHDRKWLYARDQIGSVRALILPTDGKVYARFDYDAYGAPIARTGNAVPTFGYAGFRYHAPSGLNLALFRAYDPQIGRWLSRDPLDTSTGESRYAYAGADPVGRIDPLGLQSTCIYRGGGYYCSAGVPDPAGSSGSDRSPATPPIPCPSVQGSGGTSFFSRLTGFAQNATNVIERKTKQLRPYINPILGFLNGPFVDKIKVANEVVQKAKTWKTRATVTYKALALGYYIKFRNNALTLISQCQATGTQCRAAEKALGQAQEIEHAAGKYMSKQ